MADPYWPCRLHRFHPLQANAAGVTARRAVRHATENTRLVTSLEISRIVERHDRKHALNVCLWQPQKRLRNTVVDEASRASAGAWLSGWRRTIRVSTAIFTKKFPCKHYKIIRDEETPADTKKIQENATIAQKPIKLFAPDVDCFQELQARARLRAARCPCCGFFIHLGGGGKA